MIEAVGDFILGAVDKVYRARRHHVHEDWPGNDKGGDQRQ